MSKTKKFHKTSNSETETSDESSSSSSESEEIQHQKRDKKKRKQKDKKKKHKKVKSSRKKSKQSSSAEDESCVESESILEDDKAEAKKRQKRQDSAIRTTRESSRSRDNEKYSGKSKWESPLRKERSRSREKYRNDRSRSRERRRSERSRSRNKDKSPVYKRDRNYERHQHSNKDYRTDVKREREDRRDYKTRDKDHRGSYEKRDHRKDSDRSRERNRERDYVKHEARSPNRSRGSSNRFRNKRKEDDGNNYEWGKSGEEKKPTGEGQEVKEKEKPNFGLSGALTEDTNKVNGVVVKYSEPPEARKPKRRWRLYPFKGETALPVLHIHRQSCFLVGRDRKVVDLAVDHPSCSKQHAALQYRLVPFEREDGTHGKRVRLYLIDLDSANGTFLNNKRVDARKYYELMEKDVIKFGFSTREYVLLHENSKEDQEDDDIEVKEEPVDN